jgi:hypothetical protein
MPDLMKFQVLARAELALAQIRLQRTVKRSAWLALAGLVGLVTLAMLDVAAYHALTPSQGAVVASLLIALFNGILAGSFLIVAQKSGASDAEEKLARQMRELAAAELNNDIEQARAELTEISDSIRRVRSSLSAFSIMPFGVIPSLLAGLVRKKRK